MRIRVFVLEERGEICELGLKFHLPVSGGEIERDALVVSVFGAGVGGGDQIVQ